MKKFLLSLACLVGFATANAGVADFETMSLNASGYSDATSTNGWTAVYSQVLTGTSTDNTGFIGESYAVCLNGKTSAAGKLTSPTLEGGIGTLTLNYGLPYSDTKFNLTVNVIQNDVVVATTDIAPETITKQTAYEFSYEFNVSGSFVIEVVNNCPSGQNKNKDRSAIWNLAWTEYAGGAGEPILKNADLSFDKTSFEVVKGAEFTAPTLNNPNSLTVAYASSNEAVATVDAATGAVTVLGLGSTTITASSEETETYYAGKASYTLEVIGEAANIAEFKALCTSKNYPTVIITSPVTVTYQNGSNLFVEDATGALLIYGYDMPTYNPGDVIPAGIKGAAQNYYDCMELSSPDLSTFGEATAGSVEPTEVAFSDLTKDDVNKYVVLKGITYSETEGMSVAFYNKFKVTLTEGTNLTITAIVGINKGNLQIYPITMEEQVSGVSDIVVDNTPAVYYNLQGVRVANPESGIYVRVQGGKATKVAIQ